MKDLGDVVVISAGDSPAALAEKERVTYSLPGEGGGKMIRHRTGQVAGPIGGEALRLALARGAVVIADVPAKVTLGKSVPDQQQDALDQENSQRGADALGPSTTVYVGR
jgi:hypothetical protein